MLVLLLLHINKLARDICNAIFGNFFEPSKDIVLITGGSGGLGKQLIQKFYDCKTKGIISLDIALPPPEDQLEGVKYYKCDVSDPKQVTDIYKTIKQEVGDVSILINNAAITIGKNLVDLQIDEIEKIIGVNLVSSFYTIKAILPDMLANKRGYIVTVGSVLGYMSPAKLSAYGASKSGLVALHESLTYELGSPSLNRTGVKTLLVCPGQLQTNMFGSINTPSRLLAPELEPTYVADNLIGAIELGRRGEIKLPFYGNFLPVFRAVPWPIVELVREVSGIDKSMQGFKNTAKLLTKRASSLISLKSSLITLNGGSTIGSCLDDSREPGSGPGSGSVSGSVNGSVSRPLSRPLSGTGVMNTGISPNLNLAHDSVPLCSCPIRTCSAAPSETSSSPATN